MVARAPGDAVTLSRQEFLERVRRGLGAPPLPPSQRDVDVDLVRLHARDGDLLGSFVAGAVRLGMQVHRTTRAGLPERFSALATELGARRATVSPCEGELADLVRARLEVVEWRGARGLDAHFGVDVGVTDAHAALAETGSLVLACDAHRSRGTFLVPPVHVCVLEASQIVADLVDLWVPGPRRFPTSLTIVSGPSKTADIEGILITGVHGPRAVHVLLCEDR